MVRKPVYGEPMTNEQPRVRLEYVITVTDNKIAGQPCPTGGHARVRVSGSSWALRDDTMRSVADMVRHAATVTVEGPGDGAAERVANMLPYLWESLHTMDVECAVLVDPKLF